MTMCPNDIICGETVHTVAKMCGESARRWACATVRAQLGVSTRGGGTGAIPSLSARMMSTSVVLLHAGPRRGSSACGFGGGHCTFRSGHRGWRAGALAGVRGVLTPAAARCVSWALRRSFFMVLLRVGGVVDDIVDTGATKQRACQLRVAVVPPERVCRKRTVGRMCCGDRARRRRCRSGPAALPTRSAHARARWPL